MNKTEFVEQIAEEAEMSQAEAARYLDAFTEVVADALKDGEAIQITGFGKFYVQEREAREGVNPQTREKMRIPASRVPKFTAGNTFKEAV